MILEVKLANFYSIKEEITLDLRASRIQSKAADDLKCNYFTINNEKILKTVALFGANASGKSNLIKAIDFCVSMILNSHNHNEDTIFNFIPFKFDDCVNKPSIFYIRFMHENIEYEYSFELNRNQILKEKLFYSPKGRITKIFERDETKGVTRKSKYKFGNQISRPLDVVENTSVKTLYISRASQMGREPAKAVINYFNHKFVFADANPQNIENLLNVYKNELIYLFGLADIDIVNLKIAKEIIKDSGLESHENISIKSYHKISPEIEFDFMSEESEGTKILMIKFLAILDAIKNNKILVVDEFERSLHPDIVDFIIKLVNKGEKVQLIFTTHSLNLMSFNKFRKDQIYFCNKKKDGSTDLYSLFDFNDFRDTLDLSKAYLQGRFNAVPNIDDSSINM